MYTKHDAIYDFIKSYGGKSALMPLLESNRLYICQEWERFKQQLQEDKIINEQQCHQWSNPFNPFNSDHI